jgi:hypothetical protein
LPITANGAGHITTATVTVSIVGNPAKTYNGNTNATLTAANFSLTGVVMGESITVTKTTGTYNFKDVLTATTVTTSLASGDFSAGGGTLLANYTLPTSASGPGQINPKPATVTADNKSKAYLAPNPTLTAIVTGTVTGDTLSYTLATTATQTSMPGTYPITVTLGSNPNYSVTKTDGTLTIGYGTCVGPNGPGRVILQPINADGTSVVKQGSTVPVKFTICDANGNAISNPMAVFGNTNGTITLLNTVRGTVDNVNENTGGDIPDVAFRYSSGIWIFNMATTNMTKNTTYYFRIPLADGTYILFQFGTK